MGFTLTKACIGFQFVLTEKGVLQWNPVHVTAFRVSFIKREREDTHIFEKTKFYSDASVIEFNRAYSQEVCIGLYL